MSIDDRARELIARHLDGLATDPELLELDRRVATEREVATALARAALTDTHLASVLAEGFTPAKKSPFLARKVTAFASIAMMAAAVLLGVRFWPAKPGVSREAVIASAAPRLSVETIEPMQLADGSKITPRDSNTVLHRASESAELVSVELERGAARFDIKHDPARTFSVHTGGLTIDVLGTVFVVDVGPQSVRVAVETGRVRVGASDAVSYVAGGEERTFPVVAAGASPSLAGAMPSPAGALVEDARGTEQPWHKLAQGGNYERAFEALQKQGPAAVTDEPGDLMLAADTARLSKHPAQAVAPLRRLMTHHRSDPRAPFAAFTLGRVLLEELGRPREAAPAFAEARALIGNGSLAEDALAREIEAWSRAGDAAKARKLAQTYVERFPGGSKLQSVRRYGSLP